MYGETRGCVQKDSKRSQEEAKGDPSDTQKANFGHVQESQSVVDRIFDVNDF